MLAANSQYRTPSTQHALYVGDHELVKQLRAKICQQEQFRALECICTICLKNIWGSSRLIYCMSLSGMSSSSISLSSMSVSGKSLSGFTSLQLLTRHHGQIHWISQVTRAGTGALCSLVYSSWSYFTDLPFGAFPYLPLRSASRNAVFVSWLLWLD